MGKRAIDMTGKRFGNLVVTGRSDHKDKSGRAFWNCRCDCGKEIIAPGCVLRNGIKTNCGCKDDKVRNEKGQFVKGENVKDLTGKRFGKLAVLRLDKVENRTSYWMVKCDCGNVKSVRGDTLKIIKSCGCIKKEQDIINFHITNHHKLTYHPAYHIWNNMISRCDNPEDHAYADYGGRGIKVCDEWHDIRKFCEWADRNGFKGGQNLSIERKDVNGNYCPENCCWIPRNEQSKNQRRTIRMTIGKEEKPLWEWAEIYGVDYEKVRQRYHNGHRNPEYLFYKGNHKTGAKPKSSKEG